MWVFEFCLLFWFCLFKRGREQERETDRGQVTDDVRAQIFMQESCSALHSRVGTVIMCALKSSMWLSHGL